MVSKFLKLHNYFSFSVVSLYPWNVYSSSQDPRACGQTVLHMAGDNLKHAVSEIKKYIIKNISALLFQILLAVQNCKGIICHTFDIKFKEFMFCDPMQLISTNLF